MKPFYIKQNEFGQEVPDDSPIVIHIKGRTISQFDQVRDFIRRELREHADGSVETFEDANDFDVEDDLFPVSPSEYSEDTEAADREVLAAVQNERSGKDSARQPEETSGGAGGTPPVSPLAGVAPPRDQGASQ